MKRRLRRFAAIVWPAFLVAAVIEIGVFAFVDPGTLHTVSGTALQWSETAVYSIAFFFFWAAASVACGLTVLLQRSAEEINSRSWTD